MTDSSPTPRRVPRTVPLILATLLASALGASAQTLAEVTAELAEALPAEAKEGRFAYAQRLTVDAERPYVLRYERTELDERDPDTYGYAINLGLVWRARAESDRFGATVTVQGKNAPIAAAYKNGEAMGFKDAVDVLAGDLETARRLDELFEAAAELAAAAFAADNALPSDEVGLRAYLAERVVDLELEDGPTKQRLSFPADGDEPLLLTREDPDGDTYRSRVFVDDLSAKAISVLPRGELLHVRVRTEGERHLVRYVDEDEDVDYRTELVLRTTDLQQAEQLRAAFAALIPLARARAEATRERFASKDAAAQRLAETVAAAELEDAEQAVSGVCELTLTREIGGRNPRTETAAVAVGDLDPRSIGVEAGGSTFGIFGSSTLRLRAGVRRDERLVSLAEDGEPDGFADAWRVELATLEQARAALHALTYLAEQCTVSVNTPTTEELLELLTDDSLDAGKLEQRAELGGDADCELTLTHVVARGRTSLERVYTVPLAGLDPAAIRLAVRADEIGVELETRDSEDIIEVIRDGGELRYDDEVEVRISSVAAARRVRAGLQALVEGCRA